jgi:adenylylsulfate kinase-like enzyme
MNLTGVNDPFEAPSGADLVINSAEESVEESTDKLIEFILRYQDPNY